MTEDNVRKRTNISSNALWEPIVGYSRAVRVGNTVYVAGTTPSDEDGKVVAVGDAYQQTLHALEKLEWALQRAGATRQDVVVTRFYATDISRWEEYGRAHKDFFGEVFPALTMVEVKALVDPDMMIETEAIAEIGTTLIPEIDS